jgi:hypothetical protein
MQQLQFFKFETKKMNPLKRKSFYIFASLLFMFATSVDAQIASWNPSGLSAYGPTPWGPTTTTTGVTVGGLTRGAGLATTGSPATNAWGAVNWAGAANQDATFTVSANPGYTVSFSTFNLSYRRSNTGPNAGTLEYTFGSSTTYTVIGSLTSLTSTLTTGVPITPVNLSGVADLQNVPPGTVVKFRIFPTGGSSVGTFYVFGSAGMSLGGTVASSGPAFTSTITQTAPILCHGQAAATLSVSTSGGTLPYTYSWSPTGGTSATATNLAAGIYTCVVTSASSATTASTYTVTEPAALSSTLTTQSNVSCFNGSNGAATFTVDGGTQPYTYTWSPSGGNAAAATNLTAGNYTLAVSDVNNCVLSSSVTITQPAAVTLTVASSSSAICNGSPVTLTATGANTYTWTGGVVNGVAFTPTSSVSYTVTGTTAGGCTATAVSSITVNALPVVNASVSPSSSVCTGSPVTLTATGANTYTWTGGVVNGVAFTPTSSASYTVTGTTAGGCTATAVSSITVNALPVVNASASPSSSVCTGSPLTLTATGANTYAWTGGVVNGVAFTPTSSASYTVTGTAVNGCTNTAVASITVNALPVVNASASPSVAICAGTLITLTGSGANTYTWTGGVVNGAAFAPTASASYTVTGTAANGCMNTAVRSITVNALPALGASTSNATLCVGQTATLTASGALSYTWSTTQQTPAIAVSPTITTTYTLSGTNANGCIGRLAVLQHVSPCTGLEQLQASSTGIRFYPNPNNGSFMLQSDLDVELSLVNSLGELVKKIQLNGGNDRRLRIEGLSQGIYFLVSQAGAHDAAQKIVVTQ